MPRQPLEDSVKDAVRAVADEFAACMTTPLTLKRERYLREVLSVTRAAAIGGEYESALKGYQTIGKLLGHITDAPSQHVHLHGATHQAADLINASDEELSRRLIAVKDPEIAQAVAPTAEAEAEALLYA